MKQIIWFFQFLLAILATLPFALLPDKHSIRLGGYFGGLLFHLWRGRRSIAIGNILAAVEKKALVTVPDPETIIQEHFRNLGRSFAEISKIYFGFGTSILKNIRLLGIDHLANARAKNRGVIIISGHCGNWELLGIALAVHLGQGTIIARQQDNPYLDRIIGRLRQKYGHSVIYKEGALKKILRALKNREAVAMLIDQSVIRSEGIVTEFLGTKAHSMRMPLVIAKKTGAPVLPVFIHRNDSGHVIEFGPEIPLDMTDNSETAMEEDTARLLSPIEDYIRAHPSEWLWIHRKWKRFLPTTS